MWGTTKVERGLPAERFSKAKTSKSRRKTEITNSGDQRAQETH